MSGLPSSKEKRLVQPRRWAMGVPLGFLLLATGLLVSGCAGPTTSYSTSDNDPFERTNRKVFVFNQMVDKAVALPVAKFYVRVVPEPARTGVHNILTNINLPVVFANDVLEGELNRGGQTIGRFAVNSTLGLGGLTDVASTLGIPGHDADFGTTLGTWGISEGPFLILPLLGPAPPRDLTGKAVDILLDPLTYVSLHNKIYYEVGIGTMEVLDLRSRNIETLENIERTSLDDYATTRSLYLQYRAAAIHHGESDIQTLPNF